MVSCFICNEIIKINSYDHLSFWVAADNQSNLSGNHINISSKKCISLIVRG